MDNCGKSDIWTTHTVLWIYLICQCHPLHVQYIECDTAINNTFNTGIENFIEQLDFQAYKMACMGQLKLSDSVFQTIIYMICVIKFWAHLNLFFN